MNRTRPCYGPLALPEPLDEGNFLVDDDRDPHVPADLPISVPCRAG